MLKQVMDAFDVQEDYNLEIMKDRQTLTTITTSILEKIESVLQKEKPDVVLVHGDTTTSYAAALAAFYQQIPVGHVEAGLRTGNIYSPFPGEMNRLLTDRISTDEFVLCVGYKQEIVKEWFRNYFLSNCDVTFSFDDENKMTVHQNRCELWKVTIVDTGLETMTGGRIKRIQKYIGEDAFMLAYGDSLCDVNISELVKFHCLHGQMATVTAVQLEQQKGLLEINCNNAVKAFREKKKNDGITINAGFMVLEPSIFDYLDTDATSLERDVLEQLAQEGQVMPYIHKGFWQCMDGKRELDLFESMWKRNVAPWKVW